MTLLMTTRAPSTPLPPSLRRVAQHLVEGLSPREIATETGLSMETIRQYVRDIRASVHCPFRCKRQVLVHFLLAAGQVTPPAPDRPVPDLSWKQQLLLRAVAQHCARGDIARAAKIAPADVPSTLDDLLNEAGAVDAAQLVVLAHAWGLLGTGQTGTLESGANQ